MDKVTKQCPQTTSFEEEGEPKRIRTEVLRLTSLTPYRYAKPAHSLLIVFAYLFPAVLHMGFYPTRQPLSPPRISQLIVSHFWEHPSGDRRLSSTQGGNIERKCRITLWNFHVDLFFVFPSFFLFLTCFSSYSAPHPHPPTPPPTLFSSSFFVCVWEGGGGSLFFLFSCFFVSVIVFFFFFFFGGGGGGGGCDGGSFVLYSDMISISLSPNSLHGEYYQGK